MVLVLLMIIIIIMVLVIIIITIMVLVTMIILVSSIHVSVSGLMVLVTDSPPVAHPPVQWPPHPTAKVNDDLRQRWSANIGQLF